MSKKYLTLPEGIIFAVTALALILWMLWPKAAGAVAVVKCGGEELGRYALNTPVRVPVDGANGFYLELVVAEGVAHVEGSTCPDLICQHHAPISKAGQAIVCLPGQVTVTVEGGESHGADAVSG